MNQQNTLSRRQALKNISFGATGLAFPELLFGQNPSMMKKVIPSTGIKIGVVGLGTWQTFDVGNSESARSPLKEVLKILVDAEGSVIDSSPMYGTSEKVVGDLTKELNIQGQIFYATKVWTSGRASGVSQMKSSFSKMKVSQMNLMQIHNLQDWKTHLKTLYQWKEQGLIKHIGITHYVNSAHDDLERIIKSENIDFIQVNYSIIDRNAEKSLLPTALDNGVAVLTNRPYAGGSLFRKIKGVDLPAWADEIDCKSWGQFFLKYLISHPAVTCVIPGTSKPHHMKDNVGAGFGSLPTADHREKMRRLITSL